jgi:hypothetical protein
MSRPGHCDVCGARIDHHRASKHIDHPFACSWDSDVRALRAARREGMPYPSQSWHHPWADPEGVDGCAHGDCFKGPHGLSWFRGHEYEPPSADVLLRRMRDRRARRLLRKVNARGVWSYVIVYQVWVDPYTVFTDEWEVTRTYGDWPTMLTVTRERLGISRFVVPTPDGRDRWTLYSEREDATVWIERRVVGTLVRP